MKNPVAYYVRNGKSVKVKAEALKSEATREALSHEHLTNKAVTESYFIRRSKLGNYFFRRRRAKGAAKATVYIRQETSQEHVKAVNWGIMALGVKKRDIRIVTSVFQKGGDGKYRYQTLARLPREEYEWRTEVHRMLTPTATVRHDLCGQPINPRMSIARPIVAVEVVHSHAPETPALQAMLDASRWLPLIVLFAFTRKAPTHFQYEKQNDGDLLVVRCALYIVDGMVWLNGSRKPTITTQEDFCAQARMLGVM